MEIIYSLRLSHSRSKSYISFHRRINYLFFIIFVSIFYFISSSYAYNDPRNEFIRHEVIVPQLHTHERIKRDLNSLKNIEHYDEKVRISINAFNESFEIGLNRNVHLLPSHYFEKHHHKGAHINSKPHLKNHSHCHYQGRVLNRTEDSWAAISTCNGLISGVFSDGNDLYYLHPDNHQHLLFRGKDLKSTSFKCGSDIVNESLTQQINSYKSRKIRSTVLQDSYKSNLKTRYVELVIVNDFKVFQENKNNREAIFDRSKRIANIVNALYNQLNIFIALVGVVIWTEFNEITLSPDGDQTLTNFLHYRRERLVPEHPNDNAQLITGASFDGGVVGKALKGPICTYEYSGGVNTDHSHVIGIVATTIAHELGHNFGMEHDTEKCKCPDEKCIMAPSSSSISPKHWSSCSFEYLDDAFKHGMDYCLHNRPKELLGPVCGNGFLEEGEECDCGLKEFCDNKCCNSTTCTLLPGATCAVGSCCDTSTCRIITKEEAKVCRTARNDCDLFEVCDGMSGYCPEDVHVQDGTACFGGTAYCYNGKCNTIEDQCKLLWGPTGEVSDFKCYLQNTKGNASGNCGYNLRNKTYTSCESKDIMCGTLHCTHKNERLEFGMESAAILSRSFIESRGKILTCRSAIIDLGLDSPNPGMVPNGAKCGPDAMCVNQKCHSVNGFLSKNACFQNCNHNGFCDNRGRCHCFPGFAPPYCEFALPSGYYFTVAMYIIFLCILPVTAIAAFLLYHYHNGIKTWWIMKVRKAAIKSRAKKVTHRKPPRPPPNFNAETMEISGPIPIESDSEFIAIATLPRMSAKKFTRPNIRNMDISAPFGAVERGDIQLIKPIRPAPPPPPQSNHNQHKYSANELSRSSSARYSTRSAGRPSSVPTSRPSHPPPRPPRPSKLNQNITPNDTTIISDNGLNNQIINNGNTIIDKPKLKLPIELSNHMSKLNYGELKASAVNKKSINIENSRPNGFLHNKNTSVPNRNETFSSSDANRSIVASLAQRFEKLND